MDLVNNKEVLDKRREELENIHKTAALLKDTTDQMAVNVNKQGAMLDEIETNVITSKENAEKAKKEIVKADELSRGNKKKLLCLLLIILVAIGGIFKVSAIFDASNSLYKIIGKLFSHPMTIDLTDFFIIVPYMICLSVISFLIVCLSNRRWLLNGM